MPELCVDPELKKLIPPLTPEEYRQLEENIVAEGCRDALVVWGDVIVDGHNRYEICRRHGIEFKVVPKEFESREEAEDWIDMNQLGRRNLTPDQTRLLRGRRYSRTKKNREDNLKQYAPKGQNVPSEKTTAETLAEQHGVTDKTIKRDGKFYEELETYKEKYPEQVQGIYEGTKRAAPVLKDIRRIEKQHDIRRVDQRELQGKYNIIYADPPWEYDISNTAVRGSAEDHYPTMTIEDIKALPVKEIALDNSALFLWTTTSMIRKAFSVIDSWGFEFKTSMVWVKNHIGTGYYVRSKHEILLIGIRGSFRPMTTALPESVIVAPKEMHSKKPEIFYETIERMYPGQKYIELFARSKRTGWETWGNEA